MYISAQPFGTGFAENKGEFCSFKRVSKGRLVFPRCHPDAGVITEADPAGRTKLRRLLVSIMPK